MATCSVCGAQVEGAEHCGAPVREDSESDFNASAGHGHNCC